LCAVAPPASGISAPASQFRACRSVSE
jgi:hypothetical protein